MLSTTLPVRCAVAPQELLPIIPPIVQFGWVAGSGPKRRLRPEPATHLNCTLGGMIGNNSCGATAQRTGKVVDNIAALEVLLYDGTRFWCGPTSDDEYARIERRGDRRARDLPAGCGALRERATRTRSATRYPDIPRRVSGYNLDSLLPEHGFDSPGCWSAASPRWSPCCGPSCKLVPVAHGRSLVVLGYPDVERPPTRCRRSCPTSPSPWRAWTTG